MGSPWLGYISTVQWAARGWATYPQYNGQPVAGLHIHSTMGSPWLGYISTVQWAARGWATYPQYNGQPVAGLHIHSTMGSPWLGYISTVQWNLKLVYSISTVNVARHVPPCSYACSSTLNNYVTRIVHNNDNFPSYIVLL